jgi:hypothetical protein
MVRISIVCIPMTQTTKQRIPIKIPADPHE